MAPRYNAVPFSYGYDDSGQSPSARARAKAAAQALAQAQAAGTGSPIHATTQSAMSSARGAGEAFGPRSPTTTVMSAGLPGSPQSPQSPLSAASAALGHQNQTNDESRRQTWELPAPQMAMGMGHLTSPGGGGGAMGILAVRSDGVLEARVSPQAAAALAATGKNLIK